MIQRPHLLIVDDDPDYRALLVSILKNDYFIIQAPDGAAGVKLASEHKPEIIVLDMQMPGWDGVRVLRELRACPKLKSVPVLILSAESERDSVLESRDAGADDYLIKNLRLKQMLPLRIRALLARTRDQTTAVE